MQGASVDEIAEQARGYWERVVDAIGVVPPKDAMRAGSQSAACTLTVNQFTLAGPDEWPWPAASLAAFVVLGRVHDPAVRQSELAVSGARVSRALRRCTARRFPRG